MYARIIIFMILLEILFVGNSHELSTDQIVVVFDNNAWHSIELGNYYMKKRGIPKENIMRVLTTEKERVRSSKK